METLIARLTEGSGRDRELDAEIARIFSEDRHRDDWCEFCGELTTDTRCPALTTSLDACRALAERVLPGWYFVHDSGRARTIISGYDGDTDTDKAEDVIATHKEWTRAFLIAILRAHAARENGNG